MKMDNEEVETLFYHLDGLIGEDKATALKDFFREETIADLKGERSGNEAQTEMEISVMKALQFRVQYNGIAMCPDRWDDWDWSSNEGPKINLNNLYVEYIIDGVESEHCGCGETKKDYQRQIDKLKGIVALLKRCQKFAPDGEDEE